MQIAAEVEALDPGHRCASYWDGKAQREAAVAGLLPWRRRGRTDQTAGPADKECGGRKRRGWARTAELCSHKWTSGPTLCSR